MKKIMVVLAAMVVAVFVASSVYAADAAIKGKVKVDGAKVMLVKADGKSVELTGKEVEAAKKLDGKDVEVTGDEKDGKVEAKAIKAAAAADVKAPAKADKKAAK